MRLVEQAIFAPFETDRDAGYQVVARSAGVCQADARELAVWEPGSDSLMEGIAAEESLNFHPLPSGAFCLSRTTLAGWHRGGARRVYTHCLILPEEVLTRFANNPFAVAQAILRRDLWLEPGRPFSRLQPFALPGGEAAVDQALLQQLSVDAGPQHMAALVQAAREAVCLAIQGGRPAWWMAGLFSCLPPECRLEFSFTTGLKFSTRRPFRLGALSDDPAERLWVASYPNVTVLPLDQSAAPTLMDGWARLIERTLAAGHIDFLAAQISKCRSDLTLDDLPALGLQLLESLDCSGYRDDVDEEKPEANSPAARAHAAHRRFQKSMEVAAGLLAATAPAAPGDTADCSVMSPEVLEKLEHLDDLVYEAIAGQADSLAELRLAWPRIVGDLRDEALAETREQYLRSALSIWEEVRRGTHDSRAS